MKTAFASVACLAAVAVAQRGTPLVSPAISSQFIVPNMGYPSNQVFYPPQYILPGQEVVAGQIGTPSTMPSTAALLSHLGSFYDMSHVSNANTNTPVSIVHVFDPTTKKFTHLSIDVEKVGDTYFVPVCSIDAIKNAGMTGDIPMDECKYGVRLGAVPRNAAKADLAVLETVADAIMSASESHHRPANVFNQTPAPQQVMRFPPTTPQ